MGAKRPKKGSRDPTRRMYGSNSSSRWSYSQDVDLLTRNKCRLWFYDEKKTIFQSSENCSDFNRNCHGKNGVRTPSILWDIWHRCATTLPGYFADVQLRVGLWIVARMIQRTILGCSILKRLMFIYVHDQFRMLNFRMFIYVQFRMLNFRILGHFKTTFRWWDSRLASIFRWCSYMFMKEWNEPCQWLRCEGLVRKTWECKMECGKTGQHGCRTKYIYINT